MQKINFIYDNSNKNIDDIQKQRRSTLAGEYNILEKVEYI